MSNLIGVASILLALLVYVIAARLVAEVIIWIVWTPVIRAALKDATPQQADEILQAFMGLAPKRIVRYVRKKSNIWGEM